MFNNVYQDYINSILGTTPRSQVNINTQMPNNHLKFENANIPVPRNTYYRFPNSNNFQNDLTKLYPEIYKLLNPMVQSACMRYTSPLTEETLNKMVDEIYNNFTTEDNTIININLTNYPKTNSKNKDLKTDKNSSNINTSSNVTTKSTATQTASKSSTSDMNYSNNSINILKDLIKILIIKELIIRQGNEHMPNEIKYGSEQFGIYEDPSKMYSNFDEGYNIFGF